MQKLKVYGAVKLIKINQKLINWAKSIFWLLIFWDQFLIKIEFVDIYQIWFLNIKNSASLPGDTKIHFTDLRWVLFKKTEENRWILSMWLWFTKIKPLITHRQSVVAVCRYVDTETLFHCQHPDYLCHCIGIHENKIYRIYVIWLLYSFFYPFNCLQNHIRFFP